MKFFIKYILLVLTQLIFILGCVDSSMQFDNDPKGNFDALWNILDRNYCFFEYKEIDWDDIYIKYRSRITNDITNDGLFKLMGEMLGELKDGHVNLISYHDVSRYWEWRDDYPSNYDSSLRDKYLGDDYGIASGLLYNFLEDNVGYIYYGSFSNSLSDNSISQVLSRMSICDGIIIDVRNNGGGNLLNVDKLARRFFNEKTLVGYISHKVGYGHNDFSKPYPKYIDSYNGIRYQKPVVVLTNRGCYSATNDFVNVMKNCPTATILGDKTGGGSGLPFSSELPNGWSVRFSASPMFDVNKEHIEFGIEPDVYVTLKGNDIAKNKDTLIETARKLIKGEL